MKYRSKPVIKEAIKWSGNYVEICQFVGKNLDYNCNGEPGPQELIIPTLEGEHVALMGDYIIKGIKGEFYPCKPDIFEMSYEPVEEKVQDERG